MEFPTSFFHRSRKWLIALAVFVFLAVVLLLSIDLDKGLPDMLRASSHEPLYQDALQIAKQDPAVQSQFGILEPVSKLAMLEGSAIYSAGKDTVAFTVRVTGTKGAAKMDVTAIHMQNKWQYQSIVCRGKNKPQIQILP